MASTASLDEAAAASAVAVVDASAEGSAFAECVVVVVAFVGERGEEGAVASAGEERGSGQRNSVDSGL